MHGVLICIFFLCWQFISCTATDYCALCPGGTHILCKYKEGISRNCIDYSGSDITPNIKANIVDLHNSLRNKVALGMEDRGLPGPQPAASNMLLLKWDDELALIAQRLADQCTGYNFNNFQDECKITDRFDVGQNVISVVNEYSMKPNFTYMIYVWYNQVENFNRLKVDNLRGLTVNATSVGYYTQLIWAKTEYVGCGHSSFLGNTSIHGGPVDEYLIHRFICNYGPSGNKIGAAVYKRGLPCASCLECDKKYTGLCTKLKPDTRKHFHHFYGNRPRGTTLTAQIITTIGAFVQLKSVSKMQIVPNKLAALELESDAIFEYIADQLKQDPSKGKSVNGIFLYKITKNGKQAKQWTMDLKAGVVYEGEPKEKPNTTLTISDEDFMLLATNKLNPQVAFMKGKLKVTGNVMLAQKLGPLLKANSKL